MPPPDTSPRRHFWERFTPQDRTAGADLAALRRGLGRQAGDVPQMWSYYTTLNQHGELRPELVAEHAALSLFALHQQSQAVPMHRVGTGLGSAALELRNSDQHSSEAIDRRMGMVATATSPTELIGHLRGLVTLLRQVAQPLDYTQLYQDIYRWHFPESCESVRRRWGGQYYDRRKRPRPQDGNETTSAA